MIKLTIYTAIFGGYDDLIEQPQFEEVKYICFTDNKKIKSDTWEVVYMPTIYGDPNRCAKFFKVLPHYLAPMRESEWSLWVDGNIKVMSNPLELIDEAHPYMLYDHMKTNDKRDCIYKEAEAIFYLGNIHPEKKYKDDPQLILKQMEKYKEKGMPADFGLVTTPIMLRKHYNSSVNEHNDFWWEEICNHSKRDQLSFDYARWTLGTPIHFLEGDSRDNKYFKNVSGHNKIK